MTKRDLDEILSSLRAAGVMQARLSLPGLFDLQVVLGPEPLAQTAVGDESTPGGWKGPVHLDEFDGEVP